MNATHLAAIALLLWVLGLGHYVRAVVRGAAPRHPIGPAIGVIGGGGLAAVAIALAIDGDTLGAVIALAALPLGTAPVFLFIHSQRRVPVGGIRVKVGEPLPAFETTTADGQPFASRRFAGQRVLLKFYRGEWCPFCQAELRAWSAMAPRLRRLGVNLYAISKDQPEVARRHRDRDALDMTVLCDPELDVIRRFGLEHRKALEVSEGPRVSIFGLGVGTRPRFRTMAAPTTILVDADGVIRWIDQADDYKVRSSAERVYAQIVRVFGRPGDTVALPCDPAVDPECVACT